MVRFFILLVFILCVSCVNKHNEYYANLVVFKELVSDINLYFQNSDLERHNLSKYYTDDFVFHTYTAGNKKGQETLKIDYLKNMEEMKLLGISLHIGHSIYLPGLNQETFDYDGSVRVYYGASLIAGLDSVDFSGYQTINFDNGKISEIWEWADYGGVSNQLNSIKE